MFVCGLNPQLRYQQQHVLTLSHLNLWFNGWIGLQLCLLAIVKTSIVP